MLRILPAFLALLLLATSAASVAAQPAAELPEQARRALAKGGAFYRGKVARHGGYVYYASEDLSQRWGEGTATPDTLFVQPPGTPTVGMAYLKAWHATRDPIYREAAQETAGALVYGQLASGGWTQVIHFAADKRMGKYRNGKGGSWNVSSLDDGQTQAALQMLLRTDQALEGKDGAIHEAAQFGLDALLKAQFANGAFPQVWIGPVPARPVVKAAYPDYDWKTEGRVKNYWDHYTLNDNLAGSVCDTLIEAHQITRDARCLAAIARLGDFLILAQMPDPQPGWCQQYNEQMMPMWARKFEPPAISGYESQDVMRTLIKIARHTGDKKYLAPIPRALAYFKTCVLADGRVARFYELKTNKPLYMDRAYQLTYDDADVPAHYGWKQTAHFEAIEREYQAAHSAQAGGEWKKAAVGSGEIPKQLEDAVRKIVREQDEQGRWVSTYAGEKLVGQPKFRDGFRYISSEVFSRNVETLAEYLQALQAK